MQHQSCGWIYGSAALPLNQAFAETPYIPPNIKEEADNWVVENCIPQYTGKPGEMRYYLSDYQAFASGAPNYDLAQKKYAEKSKPITQYTGGAEGDTDVTLVHAFAGRYLNDFLIPLHKSSCENQALLKVAHAIKPLLHSLPSKQTNSSNGKSLSSLGSLSSHRLVLIMGVD